MFALNLALAFLLELALVAAAGWLGLRAGGWPIAIAAVLIVVLIWARWMAPRSARRIGRGPRLVVALSLFAAASAGLAWAGHPALAAALAGLAVANQIGLLLRPFEPGR